MKQYYFLKPFISNILTGVSDLNFCSQQFELKTIKFTVATYFSLKSKDMRCSYDGNLFDCFLSAIFVFIWNGSWSIVNSKQEAASIIMITGRFLMGDFTSTNPREVKYIHSSLSHLGVLVWTSWIFKHSGHINYFNSLKQLCTI